MDSSKPKETSSARELASGFRKFDSGSVSLVPPGASIEPVDARDFAKGIQRSYAKIKANFKPETSKGRASFILSEHVSSQLSVEEEEKRRFEDKVAKKVSEQLALAEGEAKKKGYEEGFAQGKELAQSEEKAKIAALTERLSIAIQEVGDAKTKLAEQYEDSLSELAFRLAEIVVHSKIEERPGILKDTVREILEKIARDENVRIRLSPHQYEAIEEIKNEVSKLGRIGLVGYELDSRLSQGTVLVESESGEIASFISEQLEKLKSFYKENVETIRKASGA